MSSSSQTDHETETHNNEDGLGDSFVWSKETVHQLICQVLTQVPATDLTPWNQIEINWELVDCGAPSAEICQKKWTSLTNSVRQYRTGYEVAFDMLTQCRDPLIHQWNIAVKQRSAKIKVKRGVPVNPDHPPKPRTSGWAIFCAAKFQERKESPQDQKSATISFKEIGSSWQGLKDDEKRKYNEEHKKEREEYLKKLEEYGESHPDDDAIKDMIAEERRFAKKPGNTKSAKSASTVGKKPSSIKVNQSLDKFFTKKHKYFEPEESVLNSTIETTETLDSSPEKSTKKRSNDDQDSPNKKTKSPKKKRRKVECTGEMLFIESKIESYKLDHPDLEQDKLERKLISKYQKLKEKKRDKYDKMAQERNDEES